MFYWLLKKLYNSVCSWKALIASLAITWVVRAVCLSWTHCSCSVPLSLFSDPWRILFGQMNWYYWKLFAMEISLLFQSSLREPWWTILFHVLLVFCMGTRNSRCMSCEKYVLVTLTFLLLFWVCWFYLFEILNIRKNFIGSWTFAFGRAMSWGCGL